jgi:hypothetical protein
MSTLNVCRQDPRKINIFCVMCKIIKKYLVNSFFKHKILSFLHTAQQMSVLRETALGAHIMSTCTRRRIDWLMYPQKVHIVKYRYR